MLMNIGFDLDKVLINHPPFIPSWLMSKLYGEKVNGHLFYRIPGKIEQKIRKLSHFPLLRKPLKKNIQILLHIVKDPSQKFFLISSRYGFLEKETNDIIKKNHLKKIFTNMYFNYKNEQPHEFKEKVIGRLRINKYVDDDLPLLRYVAEKHPETTFYWLNTTRQGRIQKNLYAVTNLSTIFKKL